MDAGRLLMPLKRNRGRIELAAVTRRDRAVMDKPTSTAIKTPMMTGAEGLGCGGAMPSEDRAADGDSDGADPPRLPFRRHMPLLLPGMRVGILGGSFNPAHDGHRHISLVALRRLRLDRVIWLLSPQNPLKASHETADLADRLKRARAVARHPRIMVSDLECHLGTQFTADTLPEIRRRMPFVHFVWLMGADNLIQLPRWERWTRIPETMPMAIIDRPGYGLKAQLGPVAQRHARWRLSGEDAPALVTAAPPAWIYLHAKLHPLSASAIRSRVPRGLSWTDMPSHTCDHTDSA